MAPQEAALRAQRSSGASAGGSRVPGAARIAGRECDKLREPAPPPRKDATCSRKAWAPAGSTPGGRTLDGGQPQRQQSSKAPNHQAATKLSWRAPMMRVWRAPGGNRAQWKRSRHRVQRDRITSTPRRAAHSERLPPTTQCSAGPPTSCSMDMHAATQRSVAAARQLGSAVRAAAAARRCRLPLPSGGAPRPGGMEQQRAAARLGRLLSSLTPRASSGQESVGAPAAAPPPSAVQAAAAAAAPAPPPLASGYRLPPKEIADIVDAPPEPLLSFSPDRTLVLQARRRCLLGPPAALRVARQHLLWHAAVPCNDSQCLCAAP